MDNLLLHCPVAWEVWSFMLSILGYSMGHASFSEEFLVFLLELPTDLLEICLDDYSFVYLVVIYREKQESFWGFIVVGFE